MPDPRPNLETLRRRAEALKAEIAELGDVLAQINTPASFGHAKREKLETLRTLRAQRERELEDLQAQIAGQNAGQTPGKR
jgi:DNA repair exonuclease SbcCD ATPase subunit